jgi:hypothetical protein
MKTYGGTISKKMEKVDAKHQILDYFKTCFKRKYLGEMYYYKKKI